MAPAQRQRPTRSDCGSVKPIPSSSPPPFCTRLVSLQSGLLGGGGGGERASERGRALHALESRAPMRPSSAKAKGRRLQQQVAADLCEAMGLQEDDVRSCAMGANGEDVQLSVAAREKVPWSIECKNQERLNLWSAFAQAESNAKGTGYYLISALLLVSDVVFFNSLGLFPR